MNIQAIEIQIRRTQALIKNYRELILQNRNLSTWQRQHYQRLIELAKNKINNLLQLRDDWLTVDYSQAVFISNKKNH